MTSATAGAVEVHVMAPESGYLACLRYVNCLELEREECLDSGVSVCCRRERTRLAYDHRGVICQQLGLCLRLPVALSGAALRYTTDGVWDTRNT